MATKKEFNSFGEMLSQSDLPVLVDFYADWCGPCQMMVPILEQVNAQLRDRLRVVKIEYGVTALPTLVLFKQGNPVDRVEGVMQAAQLIQRFQPLL
jgi:thioredoxin